MYIENIYINVDPSSINLYPKITSGFFKKQYDVQNLDDCGLGVDLLNFPMPLFEFIQ